MQKGGDVLMPGKRWCGVVLLGTAAYLGGCIEVEQRVRVNDDATVSVKATIKIDPQYEALVLPKMKEELTKKAPPGVRLDFSQRIDGKAAVLIEAEGAAADAMLKEDGSTTITVSDGGFMKKRYEYREIVTRVPEMPVPARSVVSLPGSIESVTGGIKTADDTVEFDQTHAKRGDVYAVTSTAFAFSLGNGRATAASGANPGTAAWLVPVSIGSICAGVALLLAGWIRSRHAVSAGVSPPIYAARTAAAQVPAPVEEARSLFCTECGAANTVGRKFCGQCGHAMA